MKLKEIINSSFILFDLCVNIDNDPLPVNYEIKSKFISESLCIDIIEYNPTHEEIINFVSSGAKTVSPKSWIYFSIFLVLENLIKTTIGLKNRIGLDQIPTKIKNCIRVAYTFILRLYSRIAKKFGLFSFLYLLVIGFLSKDLILIKHFLEDRFKRIVFKKHRRLLLMLRYIFKLMSSLMIKYNIITGFKILISGKIGKAGSVKKKTWCYKNGGINLPTKYSLLKFEVGTLWTNTGCMGLKIYIAS